MIEREELLRLADRVEALSDADEALDEMLVDFAYERRLPLACYAGQPINYDPVLWLERYGWSPTSSIDAAMDLVPEGLSFEVRRSGTGDQGQATIWNPMHSPGYQEWRVTGCSSPALALTAAALRAAARE